MRLIILSSVCYGLPPGLLGARDRALLLVGFAGALRRSELIGLEALYPGELARLLRDEIARYYAATLAARMRAAQAQLEADLHSLRQAILTPYQDEIAALSAEYATIRAEFSARLNEHTRALRRLWQNISAKLADVAPEVADYPVPEPAIATERADGLYNSTRDYLDQIEEYKAFQGRD